jgi:outer membrane protein assembly factor BamB
MKLSAVRRNIFSTAIFSTPALLAALLACAGRDACAALHPDFATRIWPQAAGPEGNWTAPSRNPPVKWSVARNEGIVWRTTLPETGQSGIAVFGSRVFLTTLKPEEGRRPTGRDVVGYCLDAASGKILWTVPLPGREESVPAYFFSDASSPTPITDGRHIWFFNASGSMGCYDENGKQVWFREWQPTTGRPFNKQFEPIYFDNLILNMEPRDADDPKREAKDPWNYLRALDKNTGKTVWIAEDAMTHYNTPVLGFLPGNVPAILQGRGAYHGVPETPVGLSLTAFGPLRAGKTLWRYSPEKGKATYTQHWNQKFALWIDIDAAEQHVLSTRDGQLVRIQSLAKKADWRRYNPATSKYELLADADLTTQAPPIKVFPAQFCNILVGDWHWFLCYTEAKKNIGPPYCVGRVHLETGKVEYLEVPVGVVREAGKHDELIWRKPLKSSTLNSRGIDVATDKRSQDDGWWWGYLGSPTAAGGKIYFTTMLGITYVLDGDAKVLDEKALLSVNDLGPVGQTWSLNSISHASGRLYHRSMKEVVCIGPRE